MKNSDFYPICRGNQEQGGSWDCAFCEILFKNSLAYALHKWT